MHKHIEEAQLTRMRENRMRVCRSLIAATWVGLVIAWGPALAAAAAEPVDLGTGYLVDEAEVLSDTEESAVVDRLEALYADTGIDLYVAYVHDFSGDTVDDWAYETAGQNNLGLSQYLLAADIETRGYYLYGHQDGPLSFDTLSRIEEDVIRMALRGGDFAGAIVGTADAIQDELAPSNSQPYEPGSGSSGIPSAVITVIVLVALLGAATALASWLIRARMKGKPTTAAAVPSVKQLRQQAASALIETDNAIKTSEQELGFARAQFGDAAATPFTETLTQARTDLNHAFQLQQSLDDSVPETEEQLRAALSQIIELCTQADNALDEKTEAFDQLRELAKNAPEALERAQAMTAKARQRVAGAQAQLQTLQASYSAVALSVISDNPEQAQQRLSFADEQLTAAMREVGAGDGDAAAISIRAAEAAVAQATDLSGAVQNLQEELALAERDGAELIAELHQDIAAAAALPDESGQLAAAISATRQQASAAEILLAGAERDPVAVVRTLQSADTQIDTVVQAARDAQRAAEHQRVTLEQTLSRARSRIAQAESYVAARRGAIDVQARTRLSEASAALASAQSQASTSPAGALALARKSEQLADQAINYAKTDVRHFDPYQNFDDDSAGSELASAIVGGLVRVLLTAASGGGSSYSPRRSSGFGSFRSGGSRQSVSASAGRRAGGGRY